MSDNKKCKIEQTVSKYLNWFENMNGNKKSLSDYKNNYFLLSNSKFVNKYIYHHQLSKLINIHVIH